LKPELAGGKNHTALANLSRAPFCLYLAACAAGLGAAAFGVYLNPAAVFIMPTHKAQAAYDPPFRAIA